VILTYLEEQHIVNDLAANVACCAIEVTYLTLKKTVM